MPHAKMQAYVNVDYRKAMSIVGLVGESGQDRVIAEGRYVREPHGPHADLAFVVDEGYQGLGIATYMYKMLIRLAKDQGLPGFTASVLATNQSMMKVLDKGGLPVKASLEQGVYELVIPLDADPSPNGKRIQYDHKR
jgi:RimJ/RimL family protein N-acetyltransferase